MSKRAKNQPTEPVLPTLVVYGNTRNLANLQVADIAQIQIESTTSLKIANRQFPLEARYAWHWPVQEGSAAENASGICRILPAKATAALQCIQQKRDELLRKFAMLDAHEADVLAESYEAGRVLTLDDIRRAK